MSQVQIGQDVSVVSGPHEGRSGQVTTLRDVSTGGEPETYAIVRFTATNCFKEVYTDEISVPVRRLAPRR